MTEGRHTKLNRVTVNYASELCFHGDRARNDV